MPRGSLGTACAQTVEDDPGPAFLSHLLGMLSDMSIFNRQQTQIPTIDPFTDPVAYLAELGIEAELVEVRLDVPEAA